MTATATPAAVRRIANARRLGWTFEPAPADLAAVDPDGTASLGFLRFEDRVVEIWSDGFCQEIDLDELYIYEAQMAERAAGWIQ